jgi:hypothetical protein
MNQVISQKNINYLESLKIYTKEVVPHIEKWEKTGTIELHMEKVWRNGLFGINYPDIWWVELRFVLHRDFF